MTQNHTTLPREPLAKMDPAIFDAIGRECARQQDHIELIASENFVAPAILEAVGSVLTNKYAEGYPGKRYYGGCQFVDEVETLAIERAKQLFAAEHANVQPHSGSQANAAVYMACLKPGDTILAMSLEHGGHLTHGHPKNASGVLYTIISYGVDLQTGLLDYEAIAQLAHEHKPKLIIAGASAYPRAIDFKRFREIADSVGSLLMVDMAHIAGLVAAGVHASPMPYADFVTTTTHKTLRGPRGGMILCKSTFAKAVDSAIFPGMQGGPLMHVIAGKAVCFALAMEANFRSYQAQVVANAQALAKALSAQGLKLVSGGTDNHLILVDLRPAFAELTGKAAETSLDAAHITLNKNTVPAETRSPFQTSGIRLGTPAITTRGMKEAEMMLIAEMIVEVLQHPSDTKVIEAVKTRVNELCKRFPLPY